MAQVKKDCKLYDTNKNICKGLKKLYCSEEEKCSFYKPRGEKKKNENNVR